MSTILKYTIRMTLKRKKSLAISIFSISICIALLIVIFNSICTIYNSINSYIDTVYGNYYGLVETENKYASDVINSNFTSEGYIVNIGSIDCDKSIFDNQLSMGYISDSIIGISPINITKGRLPNAPDEAVIEESLANKLMISADIGDTITINISTHNQENKEYTLSIVGMIKNYASGNQVDENMVNVWPSVIISSDWIDCFNDSKHYLLYSDNDPSVLSEIQDKYQTPTYINPSRVDSSLLYSIDKSSSVILSIIMISAFLMACICLISYVLVNDQYMQQQYVQLKLIGAGKSILIKFTICKNLIILVLATIPGILLGYWGCCAFDTYILKTFVSIYSPQGYILSLLIGVIITSVLLLSLNLLRVLPKLNVKPFSHRKEHKNLKKYNVHTKNIFIKWMICSAKNKKGVYKGVVLSMFLCYFLIFVGSFFNSTINQQFNNEYHNDYFISTYYGGYVSFFRIPQLPYYGIDANITNSLLETGEVSNISYIKQLNAIISDSNNNADLKNYYGLSINDDSEQSGGDFDKIVTEYNLNPNNEYYNMRIAEVDDNLLSKLLSSSKIVGQTTIDEVKDGKKVILLCPSIERCPFKVGDTINIFQILFNKQVYSYENSTSFNSQVTVSAIIEVNESTSYIGSKFYSSPSLRLVWGEGSFEKNNVTINNTYTYIDLKDKTQHTLTDDILLQVKDAFPYSKITSAVEQNTERQTLLSSLSLSVIGLVTFIASTSLLVFINTVKNKFISQKPLWGVMRTMGLEKNKVLVANVIEILLIFAISVILNIALIFLISILPIRRIDTLFSPTLILSYIFFPIVALLGIIPTIITMYKQTIVEQIEYIN